MNIKVFVITIIWKKKKRNSMGRISRNKYEKRFWGKQEEELKKGMRSLTLRNGVDFMNRVI